MAKWHERLDVTDPERVIGQTADGKPIWLDMRELLTSPEECEALGDNKRASQREAVVHKMANDVIEQGQLLLAQTLDQTLAPEAQAQLQRESPRGMVDFVSRLGFTCIQDGLTTVVKRHGKVLRTMTAKVPPLWRPAVTKRVCALVRGGMPAT